MSIIHYKDYKGVSISRETYAMGEQVYLEGGQGCGTIWFKDVKQAHDFIDKYPPDKVDGFSRWIPESLCKRCKNYYSMDTQEYKLALDSPCKNYKKRLKKNLTP